MPLGNEVAEHQIHHVSMKSLRTDVSIRQVATLLGLERHGNYYRCWHGNSHAHGDRTPSVGHDVSRNKLRCFGACKKSYSTIDLVMDVLNLSLSGAAEWLAERFAGVATLSYKQKACERIFYKFPQDVLERYAADSTFDTAEVHKAGKPYKAGYQWSAVQDKKRETKRDRLVDLVSGPLWAQLSTRTQSVIATMLAMFPMKKPVLTLSIKEIAGACGQSYKSVSLAVKELIGAGILDVASGKSGRHASTYRYVQGRLKPGIKPKN
jgi:hypothetical protein